MLGSTLLLDFQIRLLLLIQLFKSRQPTLVRIWQVPNDPTLRAHTARFCFSLRLAHTVHIRRFLVLPAAKIGPQFQIGRPPSIESFLRTI